MGPEELFRNIIYSVIGAMFTFLAAVLSQRVTARQRRDREMQREEVEKIADVVHTEQAARKAAVLERVVEKIPVGLTPEQFRALLDEVAARLPSQSPALDSTTSAAETLITNYHEQALNQARAQFWFSVAAATIGFAWILLAGTGISGDVVSVSRILPGVVMDAVAFLFFKQASETRQRATELYDRLRRDKQMTESAGLVSSIEDVRLRSAVKAQLALHMSGLAPNPIDLSIFLSPERGALTSAVVPRDGDGTDASVDRATADD